MAASSAESAESSERDIESSERDVELDTAALRVLAHPLRLNVLTLLRERGPATATLIAEELGINPGAASYHLRRLASGGLIVDEPGRGTGRERWWKSVHRQSIHDPATAPVEQREAGRAYTQAVAVAAADRLRRAAQEVALLPQEWLEATSYSDFLLHLTPGDADRMKSELFEVIARYRHGAGEAPEGSAPVVLQVQAFPVPGTALPPAGDA
ncbi:helix-turn-helix domain-containing protein [Streptomyces sp. NBC_00053]|uniref:ArsR/SmtB family transcription factor n=1 Tax=unclassified Streptomyces TaxID=2593676 RepID=UPI00225ADBFE|nr:MULTISPECIES: winged helix-turn-helix domain-containing protein [unclassified Streptomyces]MCX5098504.1 helix-turn-helix domain-containing protein [Streptomyces sp. NBC_00439]MCX5498357.1 helix-turn-helix domain-containing protein [Streptomyces sp. NBC_00052]MCX5553111.1 helix-turn-helix domain-containing protein [Streptomyces sp. NBC_00051]WSC25766.1 helix-turn-helix domain-containing protein [Streptomyces sp. NBC_01768]WSP51355.1 helix-turn-helix domain-containing protein [Streptomyces sp